MRTAHLRNRYPEPFAATLTRYRLDVLASSVSDVVRSAGGWLFDRAMAGWEVNLLIADPPDARPLQILGISVFPLETALEPVPAAEPTSGRCEQPRQGGDRSSRADCGHTPKADDQSPRPGS